MSAWRLALVALCLSSPVLAQPAPKTGASASASASASARPSASASASASASVSASASATPSASASADPVESVETAEPAPRPPPPAPAPSARPSAKPSAEPAPSLEPTVEPPVPNPPPEPKPEVTAEAPRDVRIGDSVAFTVRASMGGLDAQARAKKAELALRDAFEAATEDDVHVERSGDVATIYVADAPIIQLGSADAAANGGGSLDATADAVAASLKQAIAREKARSALARRIFGISMVVLFGVVVLYLLRKTGELTERANAWLDDNPQLVPAFRVRSVTFLTPAAVRSGSALALGVGKWVVQFTALYLWVLAALGQFASTRGYTNRMNALLLEPFVALTTRVVSSLPITVVVLLAGLVVLLLLRVVGLFFEAVRDGTTTVMWLPADLAEPTRFLVRLGIVLVTLVFAAPILTGHDEGALARAGMVGIATMGLASTPTIANLVVGIHAAFARRYRVGTDLQIGDVRGIVTKVSLFDVALEGARGAVSRVPHLYGLTRPVREAPPTVEFSVPATLATSAFEAKLGEKLAALGVARPVELSELRADTATYVLASRVPVADVLRAVRDARQELDVRQ